MVDLEVKVARVQAENDRLRRTLADFSERVVCGRLTGDLPDNFLEQFSQLPDRPLEQVLRFLPARQVVQMRHVSRRFNHLIRKSSKTMPKMKRDGIVVFRSNKAGELIVGWFNYRNKKIAEATLADHGIALSELLRFIHIGGRMHFSDGFSATDEVLNQLSIAWLTIRPEVLVFSGDLSHTSRDSLKAFFVKVEPFVTQIQFQGACNIADSLLSDDVIGAAGQLDGLMITSVSSGSELPNLNIGDDTLLSMVDAGDVSSYFLVMDCSSITPGGIRAFVEKWMKKERPQLDANYSGFRGLLEACDLAFYKCANVTPATVEEACGDLLEEGTMAESYVGFGGGKKVERVQYIIQCPSSNCRLGIVFSDYLFNCYCKYEPMLEDEIDDYYDDHDLDDLDPEIEHDDFDA
uniref:F-box domain-containing protein n=1 Tax=Plectus sambesii TaxID=2011161 RepID=A0A914VXS8_9BILA